MRGEKLVPLMCRSHTPGSSPHARGKGAIGFYLEDCFRIIPACAGKRDPDIYYFRTGQDHPRMRGEKAKEIS